MKRIRIEVAPKHKQLLAEEFKKSRVAVQASLDGYFRSKSAYSILCRAEDLLMSEIDKLQELKNEIAANNK